jgi:hypothetical protein
MVLADLHSTVIDDVGIWSGMSGSPVYAANGDLIGAVSYGLSVGPSTIAGITPASEMTRLLTGAPAAARRAARRVTLPRSVATRLVRSGAASRADLRQGLTRLPMPVRVSGLSSERMAKLTGVLRLGPGRVVAGSAGATSEEPIDIQAGGNMAAAMSYGTVTAGGLGTATIVCGDQVVGFGHPMNFSGESSMSLHGARTVLIQGDPTVAGFKVANLGAPVGTVDEDRQAGLHAAKGAVPDSIPVTSDVSMGTRTGSAATYITLTDPDVVTDWGWLTQPDVVTQLAFTSMIAAQDRVLDKIGTGTATASWTIKGLRKNGRPWELTRRDLFTDPYDLSAASAFAVAEDLAILQGNSGEQVTITSVDTSSRLHDYNDTYVVSKVQVRSHGAWRTARQRRTLELRAGRDARLRVFLTSREGAPRTLRVDVAVPDRAAGKRGWLSVVGGGDGYSDSEEYFEEGYDAFDAAPSSGTFPRLLRSLESTQRHNQVRATLRLRGFANGGVRTRKGSASIPRSVGGWLDFRVVGRP